MKESFAVSKKEIQEGREIQREEDIEFAREIALCLNRLIDEGVISP